ncbi:DeoR/GlpR family DNA-binding transcription regulator [Sporosarcina sp. G11-34]|uniref:DeoR/GlpR family DNA-binding transcription regulator n=1 Tax=Sporosarcina sp. G11-34 TaxID=2849605 RepID=UPI0022A971BE|nr:DeoR/GlpR family DNA-binding transcription regulator [Sporosarcina sp. G11-34]MCZ2260341.1 DeoR/GlpR family DNA-binding transcription regulator [Sporosarcina sp. G11-34]
MSPRERRKRIIQMLELNGKVEIIQLSETLGVTPMTIRRDFDVLEKQKKLIRTHGAAIAPQGLIVEQTFESKAGKAVLEKQTIAREAMSFVRDGMTVLLDSGTTTLQIARLLKVRDKVTVITNDIKIAAELMDSQLEIILLGGRLQNGVGSLYGALTSEALRSLHVDLFFLGAPALHSSLGITATTIEKAALKKDMCKAAEQIILVADSSKFHQKAFSKVCDLEDITTIITDANLSEKFSETYEEYVDILLAK